MSTLPNLRARQDEILRKIKILKEMINPDFLNEKTNARNTHDHLCSLGESLKQHLAAEDRDVYPALLIHEDPKLKSLAWGFISGEKPLRKQFDIFYRKWLVERDQEYNEMFISDALDFCRICEERIDREQNILIPRLEKSGVFSTVQAI